VTRKRCTTTPTTFARSNTPLPTAGEGIASIAWRCLHRQPLDPRRRSRN
jgi:hypothetical protein